MGGSRFVLVVAVLAIRLRVPCLWGGKPLSSLCILWQNSCVGCEEGAQKRGETGTGFLKFGRTFVSAEGEKWKREPDSKRETETDELGMLHKYKAEGEEMPWVPGMETKKGCMVRAVKVR